MSKKYNWTTGPVRSSLGYDSTLIVLSNDSSKTQKVEVRFYDLGYTPKKNIFSKTITLESELTKSVDTRRPEVASWEVQISTDSKDVRAWIGGRRLNSNLPGNVILQPELQRY
jgi:ubiquitin